MPTPTELVKDPLFQLNAVLWLAQPLPSENPWRPVLRWAGFEIHSVSPALALPPDTLLRLKATPLRHQDRCAPDVVLQRPKDRLFILMECKGDSFGEGSSNCEQARTLLLVAGPPLAQALGEAPGAVGSGAAVYLVPGDAVEGMTTTLTALATGLRAAGMNPGSAGALGLGIADDSLVLKPTLETARLFGISEVTPFAQLLPDTDPRPLYLIPYDPDVGSQSADEIAFCRRILFERMHGAVLARLGRLLVPGSSMFSCDEILSEATSGLFDLWESRESRKHLRRLARQLVRKLADVVNAQQADSLRETAQDQWQLQVPNKTLHEDLLSDLSRFSCETMDLRTEPPATLDFG